MKKSKAKKIAKRPVWYVLSYFDNHAQAVACYSKLSFDCDDIFNNEPPQLHQLSSIENDDFDDPFYNGYGADPEDWVMVVSSETKKEFEPFEKEIQSFIAGWRAAKNSL